MPYIEIHKTINSFKKNSEEVRKYETQNIGANTIETINKYKELLYEGKNIIDNIDYQKQFLTKKFNLIIYIKENIINSIISAIIGGILTIILLKYLV